MPVTMEKDKDIPLSGVLDQEIEDICALVVSGHASGEETTRLHRLLDERIQTYALAASNVRMVSSAGRFGSGSILGPVIGSLISHKKRRFAHRS